MVIHKRKLGLTLGVLFILLFAKLSLANEDKVYQDAMHLLESQKYEEAIDLLKEPMNNHPDNDSYQILAARAFEALAIEAFRDSLLSENDKTAKLDNVKEKEQYYKSKAREHYDKAIALDSKNVWAYIGRATSSDDPAEQEFWAKQAIEKFPYTSTGAFALLHSQYLAKAFEEKNSGNIDEALNWLNKVKILDAKYIERMESAPEEAFQDLFKHTSKEMNKDLFFKDLKEKSRGISNIEKEWKEKYNK